MFRNYRTFAAVVCPLLSSCTIENGLSSMDKADEPEDVGGIDTGYMPPWDEDCVSVDSSQMVEPANGWTESSVCSFWDDPIDLNVELGNMKVTSMKIVGTGSSQSPGSNDIRFVAVKRKDDGSGLYPDDANYVTADVTADPNTAGAWVAEFGSGDLGTLDNCSPNCVWKAWYVEINDQTSVAADTCDDYLPEIEVCMDWEMTNGKRHAPSNSTCSAGSGRFQLLPFRQFDKDEDGNKSVVLRAVQKSGTGALTGSAWITDIDLVTDQGETIRVVKKNMDYAFDATDSLLDANNVSIALQSTNDFQEGFITGSAPFVLQEVAGDTTANFVVDMEWTCGSLQAHEDLTPSQGFSFALSDLDCVQSWPQRFTFRPKPYISPKYAQVEIYGTLNDRIRIALEPNSSSGYDFSFDRAGLKFEGSLNSYNAANGASVTVDELSFAGVDLCTTGTYTADAED